MKKLLLTLVACIVAIAANATTVYFQNTGGWSSVAVHYWGGSSSTSWPGDPVTETVEIDGVTYYQATVPDDSTGIIFDSNVSNGAQQTVNLTVFSEGSVFSFAKNGQGQGGSIDPIGTITNVNGTYTFTPAGEVVITYEYLYFPVSTFNYEKVYVYTWDPPLTDQWPGTAMEKKTINNNEFWEFPIDSRVFPSTLGGLQINNGGNPTQVELYNISVKPNDIINIYSGVVGNDPETWTPNIEERPAYMDWWVNLNGDFHPEGDNGKQPNKEGIASWEDQAIGADEVWIKIWYDNAGHFYYATDAEVGKWVQCQSSTSDAATTIKGQQAGCVFDVQYNVIDNTIMFTLIEGQLKEEGPTGPKLYLVGYNVGGNDTWNTADDTNEMTQTADKVYEWSGDILGSLFKINGGDWNTYNIGAPADASNNLTVGTPFKTVNGDGSQDIRFGPYGSVTDVKVVYDMNTDLLTVTGTPQGPATLYAIGNIGVGATDFSYDNNVKFNASNGIYTAENVVVVAQDDGENGYINFCTALPPNEVNPWNQLGIRYGAESENLEVSDGESYNLVASGNPNSFMLAPGKWNITATINASTVSVKFDKVVETNPTLVIASAEVENITANSAVVNYTLTPTDISGSAIYTVTVAGEAGYNKVVDDAPLTGTVELTGLDAEKLYTMVVSATAVDGGVVTQAATRQVTFTTLAATTEPEPGDELDVTFDFTSIENDVKYNSNVPADTDDWADETASGNKSFSLNGQKLTNEGFTITNSGTAKLYHVSTGKNDLRWGTGDATATITITAPEGYVIDSMDMASQNTASAFKKMSTAEGELTFDSKTATWSPNGMEYNAVTLTAGGNQRIDYIAIKAHKLVSEGEVSYALYGYAFDPNQQDMTLDEATGNYTVTATAVRQIFQVVKLVDGVISEYYGPTEAGDVNGPGEYSGAVTTNGTEGGKNWIFNGVSIPDPLTSKEFSFTFDPVTMQLTIADVTSDTPALPEWSSEPADGAKIAFPEDMVKVFWGNGEYKLSMIGDAEGITATVNQMEDVTVIPVITDANPEGEENDPNYVPLEDNCLALILDIDPMSYAMYYGDWEITIPANTVNVIVDGENIPNEQVVIRYNVNPDNAVKYTEIVPTVTPAAGTSEDAATTVEELSEITMSWGGNALTLMNGVFEFRIEGSNVEGGRQVITPTVKGGNQLVLDVAQYVNGNGAYSILIPGEAIQINEVSNGDAVTTYNNEQILYYNLEAQPEYKYTSIWVVGNGTDMTWDLPGTKYDVNEEGKFVIELKNVNSFKFATVETTDWDAAETGFNANAYATGSTTFGDDVANQGGQTLPLVNWGENQELPWVGDYTLTIDLESEPMTMTAYTATPKPVGAPDVYIRGGMNNWLNGASQTLLDLWKFTYDEDADEYTFECSADKGTIINTGVEFKFADLNWSPINYSYANTVSTFNEPLKLYYNSNANTKVGAPFEGTITFKITGNQQATATFTKPGEEPVVPSTMYVIGNVNGEGWSPVNVAEMTPSTSDDGVFTIEDVNISGDSYFGLTVNKGASDSDWATVNAWRFGPEEANTDAVVGDEGNAVYPYDDSIQNSWHVEPGNYNMTFDYNEMMLYIEAVPTEEVVTYEISDAISTTGQPIVLELDEMTGMATATAAVVPQSFNIQKLVNGKLSVTYGAASDANAANQITHYGDYNAMINGVDWILSAVVSNELIFTFDVNQLVLNVANAKAEENNPTLALMAEVKESDVTATTATISYTITPTDVPETAVYTVTVAGEGGFSKVVDNAPLTGSVELTDLNPETAYTFVVSAKAVAGDQAVEADAVNVSFTTPKASTTEPGETSYALVGTIFGEGQQVKAMTLSGSTATFTGVVNAGVLSVQKLDGETVDVTYGPVSTADAADQITVLGSYNGAANANEWILSAAVAPLDGKELTFTFNTVTYVLTVSDPNSTDQPTPTPALTLEAKASDVTATTATIGYTITPTDVPETAIYTVTVAGEGGFSKVVDNAPLTGSVELTDLNPETAYTFVVSAKAVAGTQAVEATEVTVTFTTLKEGQTTPEPGETSYALAGTIFGEGQQVKSMTLSGSTATFTGVVKAGVLTVQKLDGETVDVTYGPVSTADAADQITALGSYNGAENTNEWILSAAVAPLDGKELTFTFNTVTYVLTVSDPNSTDQPTPEVPKSLYVMGDVNGLVWNPQQGVKMEGGNGMFTLSDVAVSDAWEGNGYLSFTESLSATADDWNGLGQRYGATSKDLEIVVDAEMALVEGDNAFMLPSGIYDITVDFSDASAPVVVFSQPALITEDDFADVSEDAAINVFNVEEDKISIRTSNPDKTATILVTVPAGFDLYYKVVEDAPVAPQAEEGYEESANGEITLSEGTGKLYLVLEKDGVASNAYIYDYEVIYDNTLGVAGIEAEEDVEYFTIQGVKVQNPEKGIYIKVKNGKEVTKVVI